MVRKVLAAAAVYVVVEGYVAVLVAHQLGAAVTVLLLAAIGVVGSRLLRRTGLRTRAALRGGGDPSEVMGRGAITVLAAGLVTLPGFVTAALGAVLLIPPVTAAVARRTRLSGRLAEGSWVSGGPAWRMGRPSGAGTVIEGEVLSERDADEGPRPPRQVPPADR
ncbi:MAG: FxsA protein [Arthrobacter sp.]|nr:FxsA protein [Arthrobacter sp.]